jgi:hypothetical protein
LSEKHREAERKAFQKGQDDFRANKDRDSNPYPPVSPYYAFWEQGWQAEYDVSYRR